jgi:hypothetical protein
MPNIELINFFYSGGTQNTTPDDSLGGFPSPTEVSDMKNNLFDDILPIETTDGRTDYRCIYIFNDDLDAKYDIKVYIEYLTEIGATIYLGVLLQNAIQSLRFTQIPTGGTFTISVQGLKSSTITWNSDPDTLATNIQTAIRDVTDCDVIVNTPGVHFYKITFKGDLGSKSLTTMSITDNNLLPSGTIFPTTAHVILGSPINTIAPDTGFKNINPTGVPFGLVLSPGVLIGTLYPAEGFPIWVKRIVDSGFEAVQSDGYILKTEVTGTVLN